MDVVIWILLAYVALNVLAWLLSLAAFRVWARKVRWTADGLMPDAVPFEKGSGADAVLFIHGFNDVPAVWRRFAGPFVAKGFHVEALHLEGLGELRTRFFGGFPLARWQQAVTDRVNALAEAHDRVFLVGHSMGGALALDAAYRHDFWREKARYAYAPLAGVALLAPLVDVSRARSPLLPARTWFRLSRVLLPGLRYLPSVFSETQGTEDDPSFTYRRDRYMSVAVLGAMFALVRRLRALDKSRVVTPVRVYVAGNDRVVDSEAAHRWFAACPATRAIVDVPDAPHVLPLVAGWRRMAGSLAACFAARE